jgi:hypothetical protein
VPRKPKPEAPPKCFYCDEPSSLLCDWPLGIPDDNKVEMITCDRPLCTKHARRTASGIICGRGRGHTCERLSIDYCLVHGEGQPSGVLIRPRKELIATRKAGLDRTKRGLFEGQA